MIKFFSNMEEWHSFVLGWCEVICYLKERIPLENDDVKEMVSRERWYYTFGRAMGAFTWVIIIVAIVKRVVL